MRFLILVFTACLSQVTLAVDSIHLPTDKIPVMGSGDPTRFEGFTPGRNDENVEIPAGQTHVIAAGQAEACRYVIIRGKLEVHGTLEANTVTVLDGGEYVQTGTLSFDDTPIDLHDDPLQYSRGLVAVGGKVRLSGQRKDKAAWLVEPVTAGATTLKLASATIGWRAGDKLILPDTRNIEHPINHYSAVVTPGAIGEQVEQVTIASIADRTVTLAAPVQFSHKPIVVANLTRSCVVRSLDPSVRGHAFFTGTAEVDLRYVEFRDLGRTTVDPIDNTTLNEDGTINHEGANQIGRYSCHFHHLAKPYYAEGIVTNGSPRWGITIHNTHRGTLRESIAYNCVGGGIVVEGSGVPTDNSEYQNTIEGNISVLSTGSGQWIASRAPEGRGSGDKIWHVGSGFGFNSAANRIRNNIAINCQMAYGVAGHLVNGYGALWLMDEHGVRRMWRFMDTGTAYPIQDFHSNTAYYCDVGFEFWALPTNAEIFFRGLTAIGCNQGFFLVRTTNGTPYLKDFVSRDCHYAVTFDPAYEYGNILLENCFIGGKYGYRSLGPHANLTIRDSRFQCSIAAIYEPRGKIIRYPFNNLIENTLIDAPLWLKSEKGAWGDGALDLNSSTPSLALPARWFWKNVNGQSFRLYYQEQRPDWPIHAQNAMDVRSGPGVVTNQDHWNTHGVGVLAELAPVGASIDPHFGSYYRVGPWKEYVAPKISNVQKSASGGVVTVTFTTDVPCRGALRYVQSGYKFTPFGTLGTTHSISTPALPSGSHQVMVLAKNEAGEFSDYWYPVLTVSVP